MIILLDFLLNAYCLNIQFRALFKNVKFSLYTVRVIIWQRLGLLWSTGQRHVQPALEILNDFDQNKKL
jgi:hypothetical protein